MDNLSKLIADLDPARDYGDRSYEEVVDAIHGGHLRIEASNGEHPILKDASTGRVVKGTGSSGIAVIPQKDLVEMAKERRHSEGRAWFEGRLLGDYDRPAGPLNDRDMVYDRAMTIISNGSKGSDKLIEFFLTQHIGKPRETSSNTGATLMEMILTKLGEGMEAKVQIIEGVDVKELVP